MATWHLRFGFVKKEGWLTRPVFRIDVGSDG